ncbi:probable peroxisomal acyl-coenzyme A oxidase 1 isoform X1 [Zootermopsis nevadensis]|uniref:Acyl-coenzyme A oxidase n=1 Tax=Zootermopsis nevadensis TaxID=136037 RepID=A0A067RUS8_ZOONE|nr:probable peroxisomal acyl-coenzyme A oxidase 1 isoform X1 [Zootermopsis nevadensis]KDR23594.1 putative peroxisomal acyl-coenzyme A oxidase 1 [Zootermopsis nevadensis]
MVLNKTENVKCNEDIERERKKCSFDPLELTHLLDGSPEKTRERKEREHYFLSDPELRDTIPQDYLSHKEKYEEAVRKACILFRKVTQLRDKGGDLEIFRQTLSGMLGSAILKDGNPFTLHYVMFLPTIVGQGTVEQQAEWMGKAWNCDIIGTYAQTELGHGTFIRGLETTAHYDPRTQEFILNSPTLTSYKWWPGGLGQTANYAVVVAQLHTKGVCHGINPFIVQLRDEETHKPLPGIKIGEIGTKLGMNATNNGYLGFENVRIPREHMLMKNAQVLEDGTYVKSPSDKLTYGTMMFVRVIILQDMAGYLSKASTIAIRYSAVRRQSELKPGEPEPQIMDYLTQQYKLFPNLAACFALRFNAIWLWNMYNNVTAELEDGDLDRLPELHALSCCLKAVCTADAAQGVEICRLSCGGHGYMTCSSMPSIYGLVTAACTYEGENTVMLLQTARYLMKAWQQAVGGMAMTPTVAYLKLAVSGNNNPQYWENSTVCIIRAYQQVAAGKIKMCAENMDRRIRGGISPEDAWNMTSIELAQCAEAHARAIIVDKFVESVVELNVSSALKTVLRQLSELYAVYWLLQKSGDFLMYSDVSARDIPSLQNWLEVLLSQIRPNAVGVVDGFDICDEILSSALGSYDGRVYERLFEEVSKSPLNKQSVNVSFQKYLKPFLKASL